MSDFFNDFEVYQTFVVWGKTMALIGGIAIISTIIGLLSIRRKK